MMSYKLSFFLSVALLVFVVRTNAKQTNQIQINKNVKYFFEIKIISGSKLGSIYKGSFSYSNKGINGHGEETVKVDAFNFGYENLSFDEKKMDVVPEVHLLDGKFKDLYFVGGPQTMRFGLNTGFERAQFNSEGEEFIVNGESYFGYLDPNTYVDGAGKLTYSIADNSIKRNIANISFKYNFYISIISGSLTGKVYKGSFSYSTIGINGIGEESVKVESFHFEYENLTFNEKNLDNVPEIRLLNGNLKDIILVGGPKTKRFGFNAGFERYQFNSSGEEFIVNGQSYFGYLNPRTFVDGAGKIRYELRRK